MANRYLTPFDYWLEERADFVRYMDDVVVFGNSRDELLKLYREIEWYLMRNLYLSVKPNWQIFRIDERGIDFVGYRIFPDRTMLRKRTFRETRHSAIKLKSKVGRGGELTFSEQCSIMSRLGWIFPCTYGDKQYVWNTYFIPLHLSPKTKTLRKLL